MLELNVKAINHGFATALEDAKGLALVTGCLVMLEYEGRKYPIHAGSDITEILNLNCIPDTSNDALPGGSKIIKA